MIGEVAARGRAKPRLGQRGLHDGSPPHHTARVALDPSLLQVSEKAVEEERGFAEGATAQNAEQARAGTINALDAGGCGDGTGCG
ncbi:hypothetical protein [Nonomuraea sp. GTA35]|uniref:hypothetical protein n=1 Tax=Nonomuraea sp. GTA35 TaxID=1676746 RepID=UPI0035C0142F